MKQPPQQPTPNIDLSSASDVKCDNCDNYTFTEVSLMKHVSAFLSPTGKAGYAPIPTFACNACGYVNEDFLPPFMRSAKKPETVAGATPVDATVNLGAEPPKPAPTKIEIVR